MTTQPLTSDSLIFSPWPDISWVCSTDTYSFPSTHINKHGLPLRLLPCGRGRWTPDQGNGCRRCKTWGTIASLYAAPYAISWWSRSSIDWIFLRRQSSTETFHKAIGWWWHLFLFGKRQRGEETPGKASEKKTEEATTSQSNCATDVDSEVILEDENDAAVIGGESRSSLTNVERTPLGHLSAQRSSSLVKPASKKRSTRRGWTMYPEDDQFNQFLSLANDPYKLRRRWT